MIKRDIIWTSQFKRDYKLAMKRHRNMDLIDGVVIKLSLGESMESKYRDHDLSGGWSGYRECHIEPDWLMIYKIDDNVLILTLVRTGFHRLFFSKTLYFHLIFSKAYINISMVL